MLIQLKKLSDLNIWTSAGTARPVTVAGFPWSSPVFASWPTCSGAQSADPQMDRSTDPAPSGSIAAADRSSTWAPVWWYPYYPCSYPWIFGQMWELRDSMMMIFEDIWHVASIVDSNSFPEVLLIGGLPCFALSIDAAPSESKWRVLLLATRPWRKNHDMLRVEGWQASQAIWRVTPFPSTSKSNIK